MKLLFQLSLITILFTFFTGCASIVSKSNWPISIDSNPDNANVSIVNKRGIEVFKGKTPTALKLKSGSGFFAKESYVVTLSMNGYETKKIDVECKLNGWYFGNIILGGVIGMLIVDPATGAMYRLDTDAVNETLHKSNSTTELKILNIKDVPESLKNNLVKL
ncbi:MAG: hypothetical protein JO072_04405 [Parafilimonas sp.]|nr:hypothetical protein [Parafilimonas sp.]